MVFTQDELDALASSPADRALAALARNDIAAAAGIAAASQRAYQPILDIYTTWNALTLGYVARELGDAAVDACLHAGLAPAIRATFERFRDGATREAIQYLVQLLRMDAVSIDRIDEDDETVIVRASGWIGVRVAALPSGSSIAFSRVLRAVEALSIRYLGYPAAVFDEADDASLVLTIFKNPTAIPERYFTRAGCERDVARIAGMVRSDGAQFFATSELEAMRHPARSKALEAIRASELLAARQHLVVARGEWYPTHHLYRDWITGQLSWLQRAYGTDRTWECVELAYNRPLMGAMLQAVKDLPLRTQVEMLAGQFHEHAMQFQIVESAHGVEFKTAPCGSGGRLIDEGTYDAPKAFATVKEAARVATFGLEEMPVYCMHCPATNRMALEQGGPYFLLVEPDLRQGKIHGHCSFHIFNTAEAVPAAMYERVGLQKPA